MELWSWTYNPEIWSSLAMDLQSWNMIFTGYGSTILKYDLPVVPSVGILNLCSCDLEIWSSSGYQVLESWIYESAVLKWFSSGYQVLELWTYNPESWTCEPSGESWTVNPEPTILKWFSLAMDLQSWNMIFQWCQVLESWTYVAAILKYDFPVVTRCWNYGAVILNRESWT